MTLSRLVGVACVIVTISACSSLPGFVNSYKIDVQQGNLLTQEMASQLKVGQTKEQVRFILGTPVLVDMFHADRWDYIYRLKKGSGEVEVRKFSAFFDKNDKLTRIAGDVAAAGPDSVAEPDTKTREIDFGSIDADTVAPPVEDKGFFKGMMENFGF